jgi:hypothetical protein
VSRLSSTAIAVAAGVFTLLLIAPTLVALAEALVPLVIVIGVVVVVIRAVFFATRFW